MKVLHIIPTLSSGGAEKMLIDIVEEMKKKNIYIEVLVLSKKGDFYSDRLKSIRVPIHYGKVDKVYHPSHINTFKELMKENFDIVHTHLFAPQLYAAIANSILFKKKKI